MRIAIRIGVALVVLLGIGLVGLALALPRIASSGAVRARIQQAATEATGQEVGFEALSFGLVPPRLVVEAPRVSRPGGKDKPFVEAERVDLEVRLLPLLARAIVVDSLVLQGVRVHLVRTRQGIELPVKRREAAPAGDTRKPPEAEAPEGGAGFALAVGRLELRSSQVVLEDRSVSPPVTWELTDLEATARGRSLEDPIDLDLSGRLASGGKLRVQGKVRVDGEIDLGLELDGVVVDRAAPYVPAASKLAGSVSGRVTARGPAASPQAVAANLVLDGGHVELEDMIFEGRLSIEAELRGSPEGFAGPFEIDATQAAVRYGEFFDKPPGTEATARGRLVPERGGNLGVEDVQLKIRNFEGNARVRTGARTRLELDAPAFDLAGWGELVPSLAPFAPSGRLVLEKLSAATAPLELGGRLAFPELRLKLDPDEPIVLRGAFRGRQDGLESEGLEAVVGGERIRLEVALRGLERTPRHAVRVRIENAEADHLLTALADKPDTLYGPLTAGADLSGPLGGAEDPVAALTGRARLEIGRGRLKGVSLLRSTVERLGAFGDAALVVGAQRGGSTLQRFYGDEFESITGTFDVASGRARTEDLRLVYRHYRVDLRGALGLLDERLDFTGKLTVQEEVDSALAGGEATAPPREKVIPLARVTGTLSSPRVELTREAAVALASSYALDRRRGKVEQKIDERLGEGSGKQVIDALEGLLGGKRP